MTITVEVGDDELRFRAYPYAPASVYPSGLVAAGAIRDADPTSSPPEVRLTTGETLYIPAGSAPDLRRFCARNGIPLRRRADLWAALLEPFIDTQVTQAAQENSMALLARYGLPDEDVIQIRARFARAMIAYNLESMLWDWCHLGLADLLDALHGHLTGDMHKLSHAELVETYAWAMALADRSGSHAEPLD